MLIDKIETVDFDSVIDRAKMKFDVKTDRALSLAIEMSASGIAVARNSGSLPIIPLVNACIKKGYSLDEVFLGKTSNSINNQSPAQANDALTHTDLLRAGEIVDQVLEKVFAEKSVPDDRQFAIYKTLRPMLTNAVFEHDFNNQLVYIIAKSALTLA